MTTDLLLIEHYRNLLDQIRLLEAKYHRPQKSVKLLAVSKSQPLDKIHLLIQAGQLDFGENYLQEGLGKISALNPQEINHRLNWHFIGQLQSNKLRAIATHFHWVQTLTTLEQATKLNHYRGLMHPLSPLQVCVQIKRGMLPELNKLEDLLNSIALLNHLELRGLMILPTPSATEEASYRAFKYMAEWFTELQARGLKLDTLSMGMSQDLEAAISAGSTLVRIGTALFGPRKSS